MAPILRQAHRAVATCFAKYAVFEGRAGRSEYWWFALFAMAGFWLIAGVCAAFGSALGSSIGWTMFWVGELAWAALVGVPHAAVGARRLRDAGHSGWLMLAHVVPSGHWAVVLLCCAPSQPGINRFGPPEPLASLPADPPL